MITCKLGIAIGCVAIVLSIINLAKVLGDKRFHFTPDQFFGFLRDAREKARREALQEAANCARGWDFGQPIVDDIEALISERKDDSGADPHIMTYTTASGIYLAHMGKDGNFRFDRPEDAKTNT